MSTQNEQAPKTNRNPKAQVRKGDPNWNPDAERPAALPAGTYRAVITEILEQEKTERDIEYELKMKPGKTRDDINPYKLIWIFHIKSRKKYEAPSPKDNLATEYDSYNRELSADTNTSMWAGSNPSKPYKWTTRILGRDLEDGEEFEYSTLHGSRVMLQVSQKISQTKNRPYNVIQDVIAAEDDAAWDTEPPEGYEYGRARWARSATTAGEEQPPHPADSDEDEERPANVTPMKKKALTPNQVKLREIFDRKGFTEEERKEVYSACVKEKFGEFHKFTDLGDAQQQLLLDHIDHKYKNSEEDEGEDF